MKIKIVKKVAKKGNVASPPGCPYLVGD